MPRLPVRQPRHLLNFAAQGEAMAEIDFREELDGREKSLPRPLGKSSQQRRVFSIFGLPSGIVSEFLTSETRGNAYGDR